jgi:hypothetical protein
MFYVKSGNLYYTGEFDRCYPPNPYLASFDEAIGFSSYQEAWDWQEKYGGDILSRERVPEIDLLRGEIHRLNEILREIYNASAFDYDSMPENGRKKFYEVVKDLALDLDKYGLTKEEFGESIKDHNETLFYAKHQ